MNREGFERRHGELWSRLERLLGTPSRRPQAEVAVFTIDIAEAVMIRLDQENDPHVIDSWRAGTKGSRQRRR